MTDATDKIPTTAEEIRDLYADVLGRSEFEEMHAGELAMGVISPWPECGMYRTYLRSGRRRADALVAAGLLPTGEERLVAYAVMDTSSEAMMRRYVTEWREVAE